MDTSRTLLRHVLVENDPRLDTGESCEDGVGMDWMEEPGEVL